MAGRDRSAAGVERRANDEGSPGAPASRQSTFASLRIPSHRKLWFSGLATFFAVMAQNVARGWLAFELTGTNSGLGGVYLAFGVSMLVATPFGGVAADRFPKRRVIRIALWLLILSSAWIGLAAAFDVVEYWMLLGASAIQAVGFALYGPARVAFIAELVEGEYLSNAIMVAQLSVEAMRVIAPGIAGVLIGVSFFGVAGVFLSATALLVLALALTIPLPSRNPTSARLVKSPLTELRDGVAYVRANPELMLLSGTALLVVMIGFPYMAFLPTLASDTFDVGSGGYGAMSAITAVGAMIAGLLSSRLLEGRDPWAVVGGGGVAFCVSLIALALAPTFALSLVALAGLGAAGLVFQTTNQSQLLSIAAYEYHGRLQSIVMLGFSGFGLAALPFGLVADAVGLRPTMVAMGLAVLAVMGGYLIVWRRIRTLALPLDLG